VYKLRIDMIRRCK